MTVESYNASKLPFAASPDHLVEDRYSMPPQVYRAQDCDHWIVEPPKDAASGFDKKIFTGPQAQHAALTYAHEQFGNARFFPHCSDRP